MAHKKKKKHSEEEGGEAWLLPYSDLMTLLLAVFIVLFAVSKVDESKAKELADQFRKGMSTETEGVFPDEGTSVIPPISEDLYEEPHSESHEGSTSEDKSNSAQDNANIVQDETNVTQEELEEFLGTYELDNLMELKEKFDVMLKSENIEADISTNIDTRGLVISLNNAILFDSGSAEIKSENKSTLSRIAEIINTLDNYIRIEGHTDNVPMHSSVYPSNWELSTARASSVVRLFVEESEVSPDKVVAVGYGEYKPIADNSSEEGRAKNRRIDIIVLSEKYNNLEKQITKGN